MAVSGHPRADEIGDLAWMGRLGELDEQEIANDVRSPSDPDTVDEVKAFPVIERRYEPVADLDDRVRRIYALLSLPPFPFE